jgi:hypothetical protein
MKTSRNTTSRQFLLDEIRGLAQLPSTGLIDLRWEHE